MSFNWSTQEVERLESLEREVSRQCESHWRKFGKRHPKFEEEEGEE